MYPLASIAGGFLATLGILGVAASGPTTLVKVSSGLTAPAANTADQFDRSRKGDRLAVAKLAGDQAKVTTVEVVGVRDTAIVYRDRDGRILFQTDPVANVTIVAKGVTLPEVTVREHSEAVPQKMPVTTVGDQKMPVKTLQEEEKPRRLVGCDPLVSPLAGSLSQVAGRCIASRETGEKLAALE
jgi:hypothetical protein